MSELIINFFILFLFNSLFTSVKNSRKNLVTKNEALLRASSLYKPINKNKLAKIKSKIMNK